jgi:glycosyltransferase involved in cell wall biosynthesis
LRHYLPIKRLLRSEISKATHLLFAPYAKYDWPTLAAQQAIKMSRKYDCEAAVDYPSLMRFNLASMPRGLNKIRKTIWTRTFSRAFRNCLSHSSLALLLGQDVFDVYKDVAPNPHKTFNIQISFEDQIGAAELKEKLARINSGELLTIAFAGQMIDRKGPMDWLKAIHAAIHNGATIRAVWFGEGPLAHEMQEEVRRLGIENSVDLAGSVGRKQLMESLRKTDIFLFCHKIAEGPRCLSEALAAGCALVGYESSYPRDLVARYGGGEFAEIGDWQKLSDIIVCLNQDRQKLGHLVENAAASGSVLDRDTNIQNRIDLIKKYAG